MQGLVSERFDCAAVRFLWAEKFEGKKESKIGVLVVEEIVSAGSRGLIP